MRRFLREAAVLLTLLPALSVPVMAQIIGSAAAMNKNASNAVLPDARENLLAVPHIATNALLAAATTAAYPNGVWRDHNTVGQTDAPQFFQPQTGTCAANLLTNDGYNCLNSSNGNSWLATGWIKYIPSTLPLHESTGGYLNLQSHVKQIGDIYWLLSGDASLHTQVVVTGTPTAAETPGIDWTVSGTLYQVRYTVQGGDTNNAIALGICNAVNSNAPLMAALAAYHAEDPYGYYPTQTGCSNQVAAGIFTFDQPYDATNSLVAANSANTTVTVRGNSATATPFTDGGPFQLLTRWYPVGYTHIAGDLGPTLEFQARDGAGGYYQQGAIYFAYTASNAGSLYFNALTGGVASAAMDLSVSGLHVPGTLAAGGALNPAAGTAASVHAGTNLNWTASNAASKLTINYLNDAGNSGVNTQQIANSWVFKDQGVTWLSTDGSANVSLPTPVIANGGITSTGEIVSLGNEVSTSQLDATNSSSFVTIPGLTQLLTAGKTYSCHGHLSTISGATGGIKLALFASGGLTATSGTMTVFDWNGTTPVVNTTITTPLGTAMGGAAAIVTDIYIDGAIVVNAGGTASLQMTQTASNATTTSVKAGSTFGCYRVS